MEGGVVRPDQIVAAAVNGLLANAPPGLNFSVNYHNYNADCYNKYVGTETHHHGGDNNNSLRQEIQQLGRNVDQGFRNVKESVAIAGEEVVQQVNETVESTIRRLRPPSGRFHRDDFTPENSWKFVGGQYNRAKIFVNSGGLRKFVHLEGTVNEGAVITEVLNDAGETKLLLEGAVVEGTVITEVSNDAGETELLYEQYPKRSSFRADPPRDDDKPFCKTCRDACKKGNVKPCHHHKLRGSGESF